MSVCRGIKKMGGKRLLVKPWGVKGTGNAYGTKTCPRKPRNILDPFTTLKRENNMDFFRKSSKTRCRMLKKHSTENGPGKKYLGKESKDS